MTKDITDILEGWEYKPKEISARKIIGKDGKEKIQLRLDLGLLQMEIDGRPDGKKPYGYESLLEYYKSLLKNHIKKYGTKENFILDSDECLKLHHEAIQYYHRYLCFFQHEDFKKAERDTKRNIEVFDFVEKYALNEEDVLIFEQYRPYVIMMNTRAKCSLFLEKKDYEKALKIVKMGIKTIESIYIENGEEKLIDTSREIKFLNQYFKSIKETRPIALKQKLERELKKAIEIQDYEKAAKLRDELKKIKK